MLAVHESNHLDTSLETSVNDDFAKAEHELTMGLVRSLNGFSPTDQISKRTIPKLQTSLAEVYLL